MDFGRLSNSLKSLCKTTKISTSLSRVCDFILNEGVSCFFFLHQAEIIKKIWYVINNINDKKSERRFIKKKNTKI